MAEKKETLHEEEMKKEYPAEGLEDVIFNTAATEGELLVNTGSIRAVRKEVVENVKANPENPFMDDHKEPALNKEETKKEYPAAALEDVIFNIAATEDQLLVNTESIRAVRKEVVENVKTNPVDVGIKETEKKV